MTDGRMQFGFTFGKPAGAHRVEDDDPFRILVLADLGGSALPFELRKPLRVDIDNVDAIFARIAPRLQLNLDGAQVEIGFSALDDFHPDRLFARLAPFVALRQLRSELADPAQVRQVVTNLVINAMQAISGAGTITVRTAVVDGAVVLSVADTGSGMTPEVLRRVFDPFFTTKDVGQGTGLGLAVVQGIVAGHGGSIEVESEPARGSVFRVRLAVHAAESARIR